MPAIELQQELPDRMKLLRRLLIAELALATLCYVIFSWHWMLICDSPIIHYVNFLMAHGLKPYAEISDNNLPGSYMTEAFGMSLFGAGDLGWRLYEFFVLGALTTAMAIIALPYDWAAAVFAGGMFVMMHGKEGPWFAGERELTMTALVMVGYAALFTSVRHRLPGWMLVMGFCTAFATSIKPTIVLLGPLLLVMLVVVLRGKGLPWGRYLALGMAGMAVALFLNLGYLFAHHAFWDFVNTQRTVTPYYAALTKQSYPHLFHDLFQPRSFLLLPVAGFALAFPMRRLNWEKWALVFGAGIGLVSYLQQRKGFLHHRYMLFIILLLLVGMALMHGLRSTGWRRWVSAGTIVYTMMVVVPYEVHATYKAKPDSDLTLQMEADLNTLGRHGDLQRRVQCLDLVWGCLNTLYHLQLVENTGFTGDLLIFDPRDVPAVRSQRETWWKLAHTDPADILVITNEYFQGQNDYGKLNHWPAYRDYINANYSMVVERSFPYEKGEYVAPPDANGYRIYVRNGSAFSGVPLAATQF